MQVRTTSTKTQSVDTRTMASHRQILLLTGIQLAFSTHHEPLQVQHVCILTSHLCRPSMTRPSTASPGRGCKGLQASSTTQTAWSILPEDQAVMSNLATQLSRYLEHHMGDRLHAGSLQQTTHHACLGGLKWAPAANRRVTSLKTPDLCNQVAAGICTPSAARANHCCKREAARSDSS